MDVLNFVSNSWTPAQAGRTTPFFDPSTGLRLGELADSSTGDVDAAVAAAVEAGRTWRETPLAERVALMYRAADIVDRRAEEFTGLLAADTGCAVRMSAALQVAGTAMLFREWPKLAPYLERPAAAPIDASVFLGQWEVHREPLGVIAALTPFNVPMYVVGQKAIPALLAGNTVVVKPSPLAPVGARLFAEVMAEAGLPAGALNIVNGGVTPSQHLVAHPDVAGISFTGSTETGSKVMATAAASLKRLQLELGGKSPAVILEDADFELALPGAVFGSVLHAGQICVATSRLIVPRSRYDEACDRLAALVGALRVGPATDPDTDVGPVVSAASAKRVHDMIARAQDQGAKIAGRARTLGELPEGGYYVVPTVLRDVTSDMEIAQEETFGPVITVLAADSVDHAVEIANSTRYGLAASVWGSDLVAARAIGARIESGTVWINEYGMASVPDSPMQGWKASGIGAQYGTAALDDLTRTKSFYTALDPDPARRPYGLLGAQWTRN
ncbi:aldehyde dehydrogenase family protein [Amycolatopsis thermoflava]|uniref:Aldehyde dehydrogenase (NAD+) n=1 Tax=Amycolatopsis thermoflava TaxID=84480 RepID=A0A3N2H6C1_9PSEU|nr:aldehyde dehydrogenase family protein [Amycolatopsis thermoflava]ROS44458.1 aldehyde dehydrogenase (NAD+) [Amycolatopsis thermoflava]